MSSTRLKEIPIRTRELSQWPRIATASPLLEEAGDTTTSPSQSQVGEIKRSDKPLQARRQTDRANGSGSTFAALCDSELDQILAAKTSSERVHVKRLERGVTKSNRASSTTHLHRWKEYRRIITESLVVPIAHRRRAHGLDWAIYPADSASTIQIPRRATWVLDPFLGSGTPLI